MKAEKERKEIWRQRRKANRLDKSKERRLEERIGKSGMRGKTGGGGKTWTDTVIQTEPNIREREE